MIEWNWIREGIIFFMKTFLALSFVSLVTMVLFEIGLRFKSTRHPMRKHLFFVIGKDSGRIWNITIESNNHATDEEDALFAFRRKFREEGFIYEVVELDE